VTTGDENRRTTRILRRGILVPALVGILALSGIATAAAASQSHRSHHHRTTHRTRAATNTVLSVDAKGKWGHQLVVVQNGQKLALFNFSKDVPGSGKSTCNGKCAKTWYPLIKHGTIKVGNPSINKKQIKTFKRSDGSIQIEYYGQPLYRCRKNTKSGQIYGANSYEFGGSWGLMGAGGGALQPGGYGGGKPPPGC
jgi:predicted lipoprotein with Yx(FWY)xxD motif